ncbi:MAG: NADPH:quinone oxidoreductase family protein [Myxococcota bacterium]|nr:NADPH:quinone oxidoreductase family protein [Myxococcota bacterium]
MRAWQTVRSGSPSHALVLNRSVDPPSPLPNTVHVEVLAAGIGLPDALMCTGDYPLTPAQSPFTQGQEVVGRILALGEGVKGRKLGDRVMAVTHFFTGQGGFADECLVLDDFCLPVPEEMSDAEAAGFLIPFHTAYIALVARAKICPDEYLLVLGGAGGTGQAAVQLGKALGARVIATAGGPEKADFCRMLGADHVIDYRTEDIAAEVMKATEGVGANVVYDPVGGPAFTSATRCIAHEGRILAVGFASGEWGKTETAHLVNNNYSVMGVIPTRYDRAFKEKAQAELLGWWAQGKLSPRIHEVVPFDALPSALESLAAGRVKGKLVLAVNTRTA